MINESSIVVDRWLGKIVSQLEFQFNGLENDISLFEVLRLT